MELFSLMNPAKLAITCVSYAPSCRRRCRNTIAAHNIQSAKTVMRQLVRSDLSDTEAKDLLYELAEYLLCRGYHQGQATVVSDGWWRIFERHRQDEEERFSDTSDDGGSDSDDTGSSTDDSDSESDDDGSIGSRGRNRNAPLPANEFVASLERLRRELDDLLQRQRQQLLRGNDRRAASALPGIHSQEIFAGQADRDKTKVHQCLYKQAAQLEAEQLHQKEADGLTHLEREAARERPRLAKVQAEEVRREEAQRYAECEGAQKEAEAERLRREAAAEAEAEKARKEFQHQDEGIRQWTRANTWDNAWLRNENDKIQLRGLTKAVTAISQVAIGIMAVASC